MKIVAFIAARMGSSRLPGKSLMPILGKPMLARMIERVQCSRHVDEIVFATTKLSNDDPIESFAQEIGVGCFRGPVDDVLGRINQAVAASGADLAIELLGDNPLVHADLIDDVIDFYLANEYEYCVSVTTEHPYAGKDLAKFPIGLRAEVFGPDVLDKCAQLAIEAYHRENTTSFIYRNPDIFSTGYFAAREKWGLLNRPELNFAVNYQENFDLVTHIFESCYPDDPNFSLFKVLDAFDNQPELTKLMGAQE